MKEKRIQEFLNKAHQEGLMGSLALSVTHQDKEVLTLYQNADDKSLFDLASLTKVIFTTTWFALRKQNQHFDLLQPLASMFPIARSSYLYEATVLDLLTHQAGFPSWADLSLVPKDGLFHFLLEQKNLAPAKSTTVYSDLGFLLLGFVMQKLTGKPIQEVFEEIPSPLREGFVSFTSLTPAMPIIPTGDSRLRKNILGDVFDDNTHVLGHLCPHAGLFGNLPCTTTFVKQWMNPACLTKETVDYFSQPKQAEDGTKYGVGWDVPTGYSTGGKNISPNAIGHLGYTGTSIWIDRTKNIGVVLLTNRTFTKTSKDKMRIFRQTLHDLIWEVYS